VQKCNANPCTSGTTPGTLYWRDPGGVVLDETNRTGVMQEEYIYFNGQRIARRDVASSTVHYYLSDQLGSASVITDSSGNVQEQMDFYPFGGVAYTSGADTNRYKFTGKERDSESNLDEFGARYYASSLGRFMTPDWAADDTIPVSLPWADFRNPQSLNLYSYALNNPVTYVDPDGHDVHVCVDNSSGGQNCFNMGDQQYADLQKQQNGQNGVGMPGGNAGTDGTFTSFLTETYSYQTRRYPHEVPDALCAPRNAGRIARDLHTLST
jgi:RHS repeat-associated protein